MRHAMPAATRPAPAPEGVREAELRRARRRRRMVLAIVLCALSWTAAAAALDGYGRRALSRDAHFDAIIVLGCRVNADGRPSVALQRRTATAIGLWKAGHASTLVFTGGVGDHGPSEARAAAGLALAAGVPNEAIELEEHSTSTEENAIFAAAALAAKGRDARRVLIVSDAYHVFRGERVFGRYFDEVRGYGSVGMTYPRAVGSMREVLAVLGYAATRRL